ncbi:MAG: molybdopterin-dependent oxidoreductase [Clostridia bacterium]|nr:molybdopterin-dependent oxidoreductase [Clostridia bacterium]
MKRNKILCAAVGFGLTLACSAALAIAGPASTENGTVVDENYDPYRVEQELAAQVAEAQLKYAPEVKTLANGVKVQRTPQDAGVYNTYILKADKRGCAACHDSLRDVLNNLPIRHMDIDFEGDVDLKVTHCMDCHTYSPGYVEPFYQFGSMIHGFHDSNAFRAMGGSCQSCHDMNESDGKAALWDVVKYDRLRGITKLAASDVEAEFTFDQTTLTDDNDSFSLNWVSGFSDYMVYDDYVNGLKTEHRTMLDWEITVDGLVDNPFTMTLGEMIEKYPSVTRVASIHCTLDPSAGGLISTWEVTGIPVKALLADAGIQAGATGVYYVPADEVCAYPETMELYEKTEPLLVYAINGHDLRYYQGFPCVSFVPGMGAPNYAKQLNKLTVTDEPVEDMYLYQGWVREEEGRWFNKPNASIFYTKEGQIVNVGEPYTFEGFADAYDEKIVALEFSWDNGETWQRCETPDTEIGIWTYWHYTFTPKTEGAYVLNVRAVSESGLVGETPAVVMVNAK